eukprot:3048958-Prymnesium_polylepis.1
MIASEIKIPTGGPVPDYPHFHLVRFQCIYCLAGWARLVYEGEGEPFVLAAGDLVIQPPTIRHRVLESSDGLEVLELGVPAEHATRADQSFPLPDGTCGGAAPLADDGVAKAEATCDAQREAERRVFGGQRFVHFQAGAAHAWSAPEGPGGLESLDSGVLAGTSGLADISFCRAGVAGDAAGEAPLRLQPDPIVFARVNRGTAVLETATAPDGGERVALAPSDTFT